MDIGKRGKISGDPHPRDRRKTDLTRERPTPKKAHESSRSPTRRPFGFKYQARNVLQSKGAEPLPWFWVYNTPWYASAHSRDQAMRAWHNHIKFPMFYRAPVPVERAPDGNEVTSQSL